MILQNLNGASNIVRTSRVINVRLSDKENTSFRKRFSTDIARKIAMMTDEKWIELLKKIDEVTL